jgi:hypothetical protein
MRGSSMVRSHVLAFALGLSALAAFGLGGCAVQTASGDPTSQTEEGRAEPAGSASSDSTAGTTEATESPGYNPVHAASQSGAKKPTTESSAAEVKAQVQAGCAANNSCSGGAQDNTQPLPWIEQN